MITSISFHVVLFKSVTQTMWADKILKGKGIPHKLIPVPRHISSDCGVCLRVASKHIEEARDALNAVDGFPEIVSLQDSAIRRFF
jgi:hypothetical protein